MRIAVIGWGSLIWCPGSLRITSRWRPDGPELPIEFARISRDGRLTLVIYPGSRAVRTYWALSAFDTIKEARENLREREGATTTRSIDVLQAGDDHDAEMPASQNAMLAWLKCNRDLDAVIWTALESNWQKQRRCAFSRDDAVRYLSELKCKRDDAGLKYDRACEYVRNAPQQIRTGVRELLEDCADFKARPLSPILFESRPDPATCENRPCL